MKELSTTTHVLVFTDGSVKFLNQKAYEFILNSFMLAKDNVVLGNQVINLRSVRIMENINDYYKQYPEKRPQEYKTIEQLGINGIIKKASKDKSHIQGLIRGVEKYINSKNYRGTNEPQELLKKMQLLLN